MALEPCRGLFDQTQWMAKIDLRSKPILEGFVLSHWNITVLIFLH